MPQALACPFANSGGPPPPGLLNFASFKIKYLTGESNRYRAAQEAGVACPTRTFSGADPVAFVLSLNLARRHLSETQRAMVAAKLANMPSGYRADIQPPANLPEVPAPVPPVSQPAAAQMLNVSERSVRAAVKVRDAEAAAHGAPSTVASANGIKINLFGYSPFAHQHDLQSDPQ